MTPMHINKIKRKFEKKFAKIGIIGLGYVGLPLALTFANNAFQVYGFDIDQKKIDSLANGESYIQNISNENIARSISSNILMPTSDFSKISEVDAILICVPTPLTKNLEPDLTFITTTAESIKPYVKKNQLIVLESTTYPGTSTEVLKPILEGNNLTSGEDFFLAYSPEREDPGNKTFSTASIPKVVGGDGNNALQIACTMYNQVVVETIPVSSLEIAEAVKLTENIFRSVNIAMVNELKIIYEKMGIDIWEVIESAKSKPFGYMPFYPGPGLGGHCIPIDPFYLTYRARQFGQKTKFIELAGKINTQMPAHIIEVLENTLKTKFKKTLKGAKVLILGLTYKKNVDDTRESPAFALLRLLKSRESMTAYFDPFVPSIPKTREHSDFAGQKSIDWSGEELAKYDAAIICTNHDNINYEELVAKSKLIVDTRNATSLINDKSGKIIKA